MKKLILTILASSFLLSCSTNSSNDNANNPSSNGLLVKTITYSGGTTSTYNYNGNKATYISNLAGETLTFTYNGDYIIKDESFNGANTFTRNYSYSNNLLVSTDMITKNPTNIVTEKIVYTYSPDGTTITGNKTNSSTGHISHDMTRRYYSQGNCIKKEEYNTDNSPMTLNSATTYTYDTKNFFLKNITGFNNFTHRCINNVISETTKNGYGDITRIKQVTYQYNSQDYPIGSTTTTTSYTINPQTGASTPGAPTISKETYTYY